MSKLSRRDRLAVERRRLAAARRAVEVGRRWVGTQRPDGYPDVELPIDQAWRLLPEDDLGRCYNDILLRPTGRLDPKDPRFEQHGRQIEANFVRARNSLVLDAVGREAFILSGWSAGSAGIVTLPPGVATQATIALHSREAKLAELILHDVRGRLAEKPLKRPETARAMANGMRAEGADEDEIVAAIIAEWPTITQPDLAQAMLPNVTKESQKTRGYELMHRWLDKNSPDL